MLQKLKIENIAIIESAEIDFDAGFNVMSGETGAGKSIIIDSINAVLGERTSRELIRTGADSARVSAVFYANALTVNAKLLEYDIDAQDDGTILLQRSLSRDGRNACRINGAPATVSMLKAIGAALISIHGQHENQALSDASKHREYVDGVADNAAVYAQYKKAYAQLRDIERELGVLSLDEDEKQRTLDLLDHKIRELETAQLVPGERADLTSKRDMFRNAEAIIANLREAYAAVNGTEDALGASQLTESCAKNLDAVSRYYEGFDSVTDRIRAIGYELEEYAADIRKALDMLDYDPGELVLIEERLDTLYRLSRKYGETEEDMLRELLDAKKQREEIEFSDERIEQLKHDKARANEALLDLAGELTQSRQRAAVFFADSVRAELGFLDMPGVVFEVSVKPVEPGPEGADDVEFLISANAGETPKPIVRIASGGELSRIMLAIKNVLSSKEDAGSMIFDEIDAGVSGRAAHKVGQKLSQVSLGRQVICVTHLAQIAAMADHHLLISKSVKDGKTFTRVDSLDIPGRKRELARIIGGLNVTELQLHSAEEMLRQSGIIND